MKVAAGPTGRALVGCQAAAGPLATEAGIAGGARGSIEGLRGATRGAQGPEQGHDHRANRAHGRPHRNRRTAPAAAISKPYAARVGRPPGNRDANVANRAALHSPAVRRLASRSCLRSEPCSGSPFPSAFTAARASCMPRAWCAEPRTSLATRSGSAWPDPRWCGYRARSSTGVSCVELLGGRLVERPVQDVDERAVVAVERPQHGTTQARGLDIRSLDLDHHGVVE